MTRRLRSWMAGAALGAVLLAAGCVSEVVKPIGDTTLSVARVGDEAVLQWTAEPGFFYTVLYSDRLGNAATKWQPLPKAIDLQAKQPRDAMVVRDEVSASRQRRYHLLQETTPLLQRAEPVR